MIEPSIDRYPEFMKFAAILLSALVGVLIAFPLIIAGDANNLYFLPIAALLGGLVGYRRRNSRIFLYFCMLAVIILAFVISSSVVSP